MSEDWVYSKMSKLAKENGGPENWVKTIERGSEQKGIKEGSFGTFLLVGTLFGVWYLGKKMINKINENKVTHKQVETAEEKLIDGIKQYDEDKSEENSTEYSKMDSKLEKNNC